jgi:hypothetical protein
MCYGSPARRQRRTEDLAGCLPLSKAEPGARCRRHNCGQLVAYATTNPPWRPAAGHRRLAVRVNRRASPPKAWRRPTRRLNAACQRRRSGSGARPPGGQDPAWEASTLPTELLPLGSGQSLPTGPKGVNGSEGGRETGNPDVCPDGATAAGLSEQVLAGANALKGYWDSALVEPTRVGYPPTDVSRPVWRARPRRARATIPACARPVPVLLVSITAHGAGPVR